MVRPIAIVALLLAGCERPASSPVDPEPAPAPDVRVQPEWPRSSPEAQGLRSAVLADMLEHARTKQLHVHSFTLVRHGVITLDAYFDPFPVDAMHDVASVSKSVTSLLVGIAIDRGELGLDQPLAELLPEAATASADPRLARVRIRDLLTMTSGFNCGLSPGEPELQRMRASDDWLASALALEFVDEPGQRFGYCSPNYYLLSAALMRATGHSLLEYARAHLFEPLEIHEAAWPADPRGVNHGWGDLQLHPHDIAKLGLLVLRGGRWQDRQVVSAEWVAQMTAAQVSLAGDDYGFGWWISEQVPGLVEANGRGGQRILIWPAQDLVVVVTGGGFDPGELAPFLLRAIASDTALPEDPEAHARLQAAVQAAASAPQPSAAMPLPSVAAAVSGTSFRFEPNILGLQTLALEFADAEQAQLRVSFDERIGRELGITQLAQPIGLDGRYRTTRSGPTGPVIAARGRWQGEAFVLELNLVSRIARLELELRFAENQVELRVADPTHGVPPATMTGVAA